MTSILAFLIKSWKLTVIGLLSLCIVLMGGIIKYKSTKLNSCKSEKKVIEHELKEIEDQVKALLQQIDNQNKAILKWKKAASEQQRKVHFAQRRIEKIKQQSDEMIAKIRSEKAEYVEVQSDCSEKRKDMSQWMNGRWKEIFSNN